MKYTRKQIDEFIFYIGFSVKEGYMEPEEAKEILDKKDWKKVEYLMDQGDYYANEAI